MGLRGRWRLIRRAAESAEVSRVEASRPGRSLEFSWQGSPWSPGGIYGGLAIQDLAPRISRDEALQVTAVLRGRNLIAGLATLPLRCVDGDRRTVRLPLLQQIDPDVPNVVTLAQTFEDLLFESTSWWRILSTDHAGFPTSARHVDVSAVSLTPPEGWPIHTLPSGAYPNGAVWVMGEAVPSERIIRFDSPNPPLLVHAAGPIRRALKLERAAERYSDDPQARDYFTPAEGADPVSDIEVRELLDAWVAARAARSTGYVPASLRYNTIQQPTPVDLQLAQLIERATLALALAMGMDPEDFGVSTTSRTYQNSVDRRQDRINGCFAPFLRAVADRLSMGDVTPRGKRVVWDLDDYLKADPKTRWETYEIADRIGAITTDEIRAKEEDPPLAVVAGPTVRPLPQGVVPMPTKTAAAGRTAANFEREGGITFDGGDLADTFTVDVQRRTITGMVVPYGKVARSGGRKWRFTPGCLKYSDVSRVKYLNDHDSSQLLGRMIRAWETPQGQWAMYKIARGPAGDSALALAEDGMKDGLSIGVDFDADGVVPDPEDPGVNLVLSAAWRETSQVAIPAFDDARITSIAAASTERDLTMTATATTEPQAPAAPAAAPAAPIPAPSPDVEAFAAATSALTSATSTFAAAVEALGQMPREQRQVVSATRPGEGVQSEPLTYSLNGIGESFVRDAWNAKQAPYGSQLMEDARARLRRYSEQTAHLAAQASLRFANAGNTTDQAQIIPPGYRPDLYVGQLPQGRPLFDSVGTRVTLANATPFKVPVWVGSAGLSGTNVEGTGPSTGTITDHTYRTVSPTAQSGEFVVTRELMDSSNPVIDVIAMNAMREEYSQDTEAVIATALAAATDNDTGSGQSTEGCYVYAVTGSGADLAIDGIRLMEAEFSTHRFMAPDRMLASPTGFSALARAVDDIGRPLFPFSAGQNALGGVGRGAQALDIDGMAVPNAWSMTSTYDDVVLFCSVDMLVGESPLLTFRFEEKSGPENIVLNLWGYFCYQILRYPGIHACNYTAA